MSDLISRKYVIRELLKEREHYPPMVAERYSFGVKLPHHFNQAMRGGIRKGLRIAETAPAIDAEPVRHSRWDSFGVKKTDARGRKRIEYMFNACVLCENAAAMRTAYCPNCGAKMDAEV